MRCWRGVPAVGGLRAEEGLRGRRQETQLAQVSLRVPRLTQSEANAQSSLNRLRENCAGGGIHATSCRKIRAVK